MPSQQYIRVIGHLGKDPEMHYTPSGKAVTNFSVAVNEKFTRGDETKESKIWFRITTWNNQAEACNQYLEKGDLVQVEGKLVADPETGGPRIWGDDEAKANFEINAQSVLFLHTKGGGSSSTPYDEEEDEAPRKSKPKAPKPKVKTSSGKQSWMEDDE